ncbi:MAG: hypothetical protein HC910_22055 [Spirulinaceae cyanobacterium SM2_1_0]|nr:hypothetical protein [Spirulinaceae cyanobacterium SM2_1_0]
MASLTPTPKTPFPGVHIVDENENIIDVFANTASYQGTYAADTNTPTLTDSTGAVGQFYKVSTGGTVDLGSGNIVLAQGDELWHDGSVWEKVSNSAAIDTVFTRTGDIIAAASDYNASQIDNDSALLALMSATPWTSLRHRPLQQRHLQPAR